MQPLEQSQMFFNKYQKREKPKQQQKFILKIGQKNVAKII